MEYYVNYPLSMRITGREDPVTVTPIVSGVEELWAHGNLVSGNTAARDEQIVWLAELLLPHPDVVFVGDFNTFDALHWNNGANPNTQALMEFPLVNNYMEQSFAHYLNSVLKHDTYLSVRNIAYSGADLIVYHMRGNRRYMGIDRAIRLSLIDTFLDDNA